MKQLLRREHGSRPLLAAGLVLALLLAGAGLVAAQTGGSYDLTWWTIDGGGQTGVSGGGYLLLNTAGQPDAAPEISGGAYKIESGFWPSGTSVRNVYLPLLLKTGLPDLVGTLSLSLVGPNFTAGDPVLMTVVVTNMGSSQADSFWVDLYINPSAPPQVNRRWNDLCSLSPCYGIAWYVSQNLAPGQSVTLTSNNFPANYSRWPGYFAKGTRELYILVDSWNPTVPAGGVAESNENNNLFHIGGLSVNGLNVTTSDPALPDAIPERPARLE